MGNTNASTDYNFQLKDGLIGAQMLFVAFGALVLVPLLTGLDPNVALFTAGAGTLSFRPLPEVKFQSFWHHPLPFSRPFSMAPRPGVSPEPCADWPQPGLFISC